MFLVYIIRILRFRFDRNIQRPGQAAFVRFLEHENDVEVYSIDTSISAEITIDDDELQIVPEFRFEEKTKFYILLEREVVVSLEGDSCQFVVLVIQIKNYY